MSNSKKNFDYGKDKFSGKVKEAAGKVTGNEQLELKGKIQSAKADFKKKTNVADRIEDIKDDIAKGINDNIDKNKKNNRRK